MNLYTAKYEATQPSPKAIQVPLNSKFAVGVGLDFQGKSAEVTKDNILLDGLSADGYLNSMAVFNLSSDGAEGREVHEVTTSQEGVASKHLVYNGEVTITGGAQTILTADLADWEGVELVCSTTPMAQQTYDYSRDPFQGIKYKADGTTIKGGQATTSFVDKTTNIVLAQIWKQTTGFVDMYQKFAINKPDGSAIAGYSQTWTIPANCYLEVAFSSGPTSYVEGKVSQEYIEKFKGSYKLYIDKKDMGVAEGWLDNQVDYGNTFTLSGTYADDTSFEFEVPTKA